VDAPSLTAAETLKRLQTGDMTARQAVEGALAALDACEETVNAYTHVDRDAALRTAEEIDSGRRSGATEGPAAGPLAGLPVAVKDVLCTRDMPTTCSSKMLRNFVPPYDATLVTRLRAAGAIVLGKTNMDEFAMGASTETSAMGVTRNPWSVQRTPGGSSGGAAAAVAAGTVGLSIGTDTGGSIRQPAAFCGVTGLKPTYGRVSRYGLIAFASSLDQAGPIGWTVADVAIGLQAIAGFDPRDSTSAEYPVPDYQAVLQSEDLRGLKIGVLRRSAEQDGVSASIRSSLSAAEAVFRDAGAEIIEIELSHEKYWVPTYYVIAPCEASSNLSRFDGAHYGYRASGDQTGSRQIDAESPADESPADESPSVEEPQDKADFGPLETMYRDSRAAGFGSEVKRRIMVGTYALSEGYVDAFYNQALKARRLIRQDYDAAFSQVDLLLGPTTPSTAFPIGGKVEDPIAMYLCDLFTVGANLAGIPAISLPAGFDEVGLPVGVQLQAPVMEEGRLLFAGGAFQNRTDHHLKRPRAVASQGS